MTAQMDSLLRQAGIDLTAGTAVSRSPELRDTDCLLHIAPNEPHIETADNSPLHGPQAAPVDVAISYSDDEDNSAPPTHRGLPYVVALHTSL